MSQYVSIGEWGLRVTNPMLRSIIISFLLGPARNPSLIMSLVTLAQAANSYASRCASEEVAVFQRAGDIGGFFYDQTNG